MNQIGAVSYDIALGVFASALVVLITNVVSYKIEKKKTIGLIKYYCKTYVLELVNLPPKLLIYEKDMHLDNIDKIKEVIRCDENVFQILNKLEYINNERLLAVDGFCPLLKKNKNNLKYHQLIYSLTEYHKAVRYCLNAYYIENNPIYELEIKLTEQEFTKQIEILLRLNNNKEYEKFLDLFSEIIKTNPNVTVDNANWEECL